MLLKYRRKFSLQITLPLLVMALTLVTWIYQWSALWNGNKHVEEISQQRLSVDTPISPKNDFEASNWKSNRRGYVALLYSGTARSFSANFESHIVNLMAGCPYTVHLFFHTYTNDNRYPEHTMNSSYANYLSINATLDYFEGYINLDNEQVLFRDAVKANVFEHMPLKTLREIYNDTYDISMQRFPGHPPIAGIYYMWHSQRRCEELRQKYIADTGIDYKWTFRMRHDAVYYSNWWQQAFHIQVYNSSNALHRNLDHDISNDWGVRRTRLYDMIYEPKLPMTDALYVPRGWAWLGGYNDQFAAMSSDNAKQYFTRILHIDRMLREGRVHPETSIRLIALWDNMTVNNVDGSICYDIVRISSHAKQNRSRSCSYKKSGIHDCEKLCPKLEKLNHALHISFLHHRDFLLQNSAINIPQLKLLLRYHLSRINTDTIQIDDNASSFYYFYRYAHPIYLSDPCLPNTWPKDQSNIYATRYLPFVLRTSNRRKSRIYKNHLTCGSSMYRSNR